MRFEDFQAAWALFTGDSENIYECVSSLNGKCTAANIEDILVVPCVRKPVLA